MRYLILGLSVLFVLGLGRPGLTQTPKAPATKKARPPKRSSASIKDQAPIKKAAEDAVKEMAALRLVYNRQKPWSESGYSGLIQEMGDVYNNAAKSASEMSKATTITFNHVVDFHDAVFPAIKWALTYQKTHVNNRVMPARATVERLSSLDEDILRAARVGSGVIDDMDKPEAAALYVQGELASMRLPRDDAKSYRDSGTGINYKLTSDALEDFMQEAEVLSHGIIRNKKYDQPKLDAFYKQVAVVMAVAEKRRAVATDTFPGSDGVASQELIERLRRMVKILKEAEKRPVNAETPAKPAGTPKRP